MSVYIHKLSMSNRSKAGLHPGGNIWRTFTNFSPDCVVMVLASMHYDEADYIRDYDDFMKVVGAK